MSNITGQIKRGGKRDGGPLLIPGRADETPKPSSSPNNTTSGDEEVDEMNPENQNQEKKQQRSKPRNVDELVWLKYLDEKAERLAARE